MHLKRAFKKLWPAGLALVGPHGWAAAEGRPVFCKSQIILDASEGLLVPSFRPLLRTIAAIVAVAIIAAAGVVLCFGIEVNESVRLTYIAVLTIALLIVANSLIPNLLGVAGAVI